MRLSDNTVASAKKTIDALLGRLIYHHKFPLSEQEFWRRSWSPRFSQAIAMIEAELLAQENYALLKRVNCAFIPVRVNKDECYSIRLWTISEPQLLSFVSPEPHNLAALAVGEEYELLLHWMRHAVEIRTQATSAFGVLCQVIDMASTVGQLHRMVPELMRYMPGHYAAAAEEQKRRSSVPSRWSSTPRPPIRAALDLLAKCYLLEAPQLSDHYGIDRVRWVSWAHKWPSDDAAGFSRKARWGFD